MYHIDMHGLYTTLNTTLIGVTTVVIGFVGRWLVAFLKSHVAFLTTQTDRELQRAVESLLTDGISAAMHKLITYEGAHDTISVTSWIEKMAMSYAIAHNANLLHRVGFDPEQIQLKLAALMPTPQMIEGTTGVKIIDKPVTVSELPPVK